MQHRVRQIIAATAGNANEWYDFALYGYFAPIIASTFFPKHEKTSIALLYTFAIFAIGFLARPLGAALFGHVGDKFGRKKALLMTVGLMSIATAAVGLLPGYSSIGILAPILLLALRILQGLAVSGELSGAATYLIEHTKYERWGLAGSFIMSSVYAGQLIGALAALLVSVLLTHVALVHWGWRLPFLLSLLFGVVIFALRLKCDESPSFDKNSVHALPIKVTMQDHKYGVIHVIGFICVAAVVGYVLIGFLPAYLASTVGFSLRHVYELNTLAMITIMLLIPVIGGLSDLMSRRLFLLIGTIGFIIFAYPLFWLFSQGVMSYAVIGVLIYAILISCINGVTTVTMAEMFPPKIRHSGTGIAFNISLALFGGTAPLVAEYLTTTFHSHYAEAGYLVVCALISLPFILLLKKGAYRV